MGTRRRLLRLLGLLPIAVALAVPTAARAEFCGPVDPLHLWQARGNVFIADVVSRHAGQYDGFTFDIKTVYQHADPLPSGILGQPLAANSRVSMYAQPSCDAPHLRVGSRYLISTQDIGLLSTAWTAVWRVDGNAVSLLRSFPERLPAAALLRPRTVAEAVALMTGLPPTDTYAASKGDYPPGETLAVALTAAAAVLAFWRRRQRLAMARSPSCDRPSRVA